MAFALVGKKQSLVVLVAGLLCGPVFSQEGENEKRGFDAESVYDVGDLDTVSVFSGGLTVVIPLGDPTPVRAELSHGLSLVYNAKLWDYETELLMGGGLESVASPRADVNAGFGWTINPGFLLSPDPGSENPHDWDHWRYFSPDGGVHYFYDSLHRGESGTTGVWYTRDNTYLRLEEVTTSLYTVEFPNGEIHEFAYSLPISPQSNKWHLTRRSDPHANFIDIAYGARGATWVWTITDSHTAAHPNRSRTVTLTYFADIDDYYVTEVDLPGFDGTRSVTTLTYQAAEIEGGCGATFPETEHDVRFLTQVSLPEGLTYEMTEPGGAPRYLTFCGGLGESGALKGIRLPTRGQIEWTYAKVDMPLWNEGSSPRPYPLTETRGVTVRRTLDADGNLIGDWRYRRELVPPEPYNPGQPRPRELEAHVEDPEGFCTTHYFDANPGYESPTEDSNPDPGWSYGLPFSWEEPKSNGRYLSTQVYDGKDVFGHCAGNLIRSTYVTYESDELGGLITTPVGPILELLNDTNRRLQASRTIYHDDGGRFSETVFSDFDGLGHYRTATTSGDFASGNVRVTTTDYNPGAGTYPGSFTPPLTTDAWILDTFESREMTEGGQTQRETFCFDTKGFMTRRRAFADTTAPVAEGASDVVTEFQRNGAGEFRFERSYGGDVQTVGTASDLCALGLPGTNQYEIRHNYSVGVLRFTDYLDPAGDLRLFRHTIDPSTGLIASTDDISGITTDFDYDALGRLTDEQPEAGHGAWVETTYTNATVGQKAKVTIQRTPNGATTPVLAEEEVVFDDLGRVFEEKRKLPSGSFNVRRTLYTARGERASVSEVETGTPANKTEFLNYDAFGRPGTIRPPDGAAHDVNLAYQGVSEVARTVRIQGAGGEAPSTTTEIYDRQGRLHQVTEPSGEGGASVTTTYGYDEGNRLASVSTTATVGGSPVTQTRSFAYDGRGFLTGETHPEKGATGGGTVTYSNYDARGHVRQKVDGSNDLEFLYDRKERLVTVVESGAGGRLWKEFVYGTAGLAEGKLTSATRHNYLSEFSDVDLAIREIYTYNGVGGRVSKRETERTDFSSGGSVLLGPEIWFETDFTWTDLGNLEDLTYPTCKIAVNSECTPGNPSGQPARTVAHGYMNGFLTSVSGFASSLAYHPNEMLASVVHANGVTDVYGLDPQSMRRPARIQTTGVSGTNFDTGTYAYDGAGNVKTMGSDVFVYDGVSRLVSGTTSQGQLGETSAYDPFGNRVHAATDPVGSRSIGVDPLTNRLTGTTERPVTYDDRGNQSSWGTAFYAYDGLDQMMLHQDGPGGTDLSFVYTADDERIITIDNSVPSETWVLRDLDGMVLRKFFRLTGDTDWDKDTIHRQGQVLATDEPVVGVRHAHLDHLGTIRLWTRSDATVHSAHTYTAFGEEVTPLADQELQFTGHERDPYLSEGCPAGVPAIETVDNQTVSTGQTFTGCDEVTSENTDITSTQEVRFEAGDSITLGPDFSVAQGAVFTAEIDASIDSALQDLDYMHARYCSPVQGRFLSSDRVSGNLRAPQSWNKYAYVLNNPLKYVDPSGLVEVCASVSGFENIQIDDCITVTEEASGPSGFESVFSDFLRRVQEQVPSVGNFLRGNLRRAPIDSSVPNDVMFIDGEFRRAGPSAEQLIAGAVVVAAAAAVSRGGGEELETTPDTNPGKFEPVRGRPAKRHRETGEIWVRDRSGHGGRHWEVYRDLKKFENGQRDRAVWSEGKLKQKW